MKLLKKRKKNMVKLIVALCMVLTLTTSDVLITPEPQDEVNEIIKKIKLEESKCLKLSKKKMQLDRPSNE